MAVRVLVRGGGEMATGVAVALYRAGIQVVLTEIEAPRAIRRTVCFGEAVRQGTVRVEGIEARLAAPGQVASVHSQAQIPVVVDPDARVRAEFGPDVLVDGILSKCNAGRTATDMAPLVIGLGPGFVAPDDCHIVVETQRGHYLGRFYDRGSAAADTGIPAEVGGHSVRRIVRSPAPGTLEPLVAIGATVKEGEWLARVGGRGVPSPLAGVVRGLLAGGLEVTAGEKIGDVDPTGRPEHCRYVSDKARQIGAGVLAAILWHRAGRPGTLPLPPAP